MAVTAHRYLIALGSNQRHARFGPPRRVLAAALERLEAKGVRVIAAAPAIETDPIGPSIRRYANSAAVIETDFDPEALLALLKQIEREFGRRTSGQRWRARVLDLDIILWSGGPYASARRRHGDMKPSSLAGEGWERGPPRQRRLLPPTPLPPRVPRFSLSRKGKGKSAPARQGCLTIPHPLFRTRAFVLDPAVTIAPDWRDPIGGATVRQLHARLTRQRTLPKRAAGQ